MNNLKELTWANHQKAERTNMARKMLKGMDPAEYHRYLYNQYVLYAVLESRATEMGALEGIETICRAKLILQDIKELEEQFNLTRAENLLCPVIAKYTSHIFNLENPDDLLAHIYVRHFGDMYGGQMIKKRNPGSGKMYEFENVEQLKEIVRSKLKDSMADEANRCFEFAMELFEELNDE